MDISHELTLVDAHVHLRRCFDVVQFLDGAYANFERVARDFFGNSRFVGVLLLTESPREKGFERLLEQSETTDDGNLCEWQLQPTREPTSMYFTTGDDKGLIVIAGRQLVSQEHLEVLAVGTSQPFDEGKPISALIQDIARAGALPIVPWGAGKWMGTRGKRIKQLLQDPELPRFFLGDSRNRPACWPRPYHFHLAAEKGIKNLPGSDPLPFPSEARRSGSFGFALKGALDLERPTQDLKDKLFGEAAIRRFGAGETLFRFIRNQLAMQYRKLIAR